MKGESRLPFWNITIAVFIILIVPKLIQDGMFTDGILYAAIAKNLANGLGTFWFPYFSETMFSSFHQQPPLTFGIQALFFKLLGESIYVERLYSFLSACVSMYLITLIWKNINSENEQLKQLSWLPVLLWIIIPVCFWSYSNNVEENTMGVFTLLAVLFIYKGLHKTKHFLLIIGGLFSFVASLCKGFPGFFPIIIPFIYWMTYRSYSFSKMILFSLIIIGTPLVAYILLLLNNNVYESLSTYLVNRVINSIQNVSTENDRFYIIKTLFLELLSPILLLVITAFILRNKAVANWSKSELMKKEIILFFLIGISASFPLMITLEQRRFYLLPSLPFFAIAFALIAAPVLLKLFEKVQTRTFRIFKLLSFILLLFSVLYSSFQIGKTGRDEDKLHDIYTLGKVIPRGSCAKVYPETWNDWSLHNFFVRYFNISLISNNIAFDYFIVEKARNKIPNHIRYYKISLKTKKYDLYQLKK